MSLAKIHEEYGSRPVVIYNCKFEEDTLLGGYVIAVADESRGPLKGIHSYMMQLKRKYHQKEPIRLVAVKAEMVPKGELINAAEAAENLPEEELAKAVKTSLAEVID